MANREKRKFDFDGSLLEDEKQTFVNNLLIERAKKGDKEALSLILQKNYAIVYGYFLKLIGQKELAYDLTQETLLKAIENIDKFSGNSKFSTWLITIGTNLFKDNLRREKINANKLAKIGIFENSTLVHSEIEFFNILDVLTPIKKIPIVLKYYYGFTYEEIATILEIPVGTVRSRLHNAIKDLRAELANLRR